MGLINFEIKIEICNRESSEAQYAADINPWFFPTIVFRHTESADTTGFEKVHR
jgi:hypothetical protein